jgi:hypothetical protein
MMKNKVKRYDGGGDVDPMEAANASAEAQEIMNSMGAGPKNEEMPKAEASPKATKSKVVTKEELEKSGLSLRDYLNKQQGLTRRGESTPASSPKPAPKAESKPAPKDVSDVTKMSLADRAKASRESARLGSGPTDTRPVGERIRSALAGKDRGGNSVDFVGAGMGMKRGGSVSSASRRADGIATKGKTRGKMC